MTHWSYECPLSQKTSNKTSAFKMKTMWNKNNLPPCTPGSGSAQTWRTHWRIHPHPAAASSWPSWVPVKRSKTVRMVEKKDALLSYGTELRKKKSVMNYCFQSITKNSHCFLKISYWWVIRLSHNLESQIMHNWFGEIIIWKSANILCISLHLKIWVVTWSQQKEVKSGSKAIMNEDFTSRW